VALACLFICAMALPAAAQTNDALESSFHLENSLLEQESERYARARELDRQALQRLVELTERLDLALYDQQVTVSEIRALEEELNVARETAMERLRASSAIRANIYRNLDRLDHLGQEIEQREDRSLVQADRLEGVWEIDASTAFGGTYGLMKLEMDGTQVSGVYRLSSGNRGSVHGTLVGDTLKMTRTDARLGDDMWINGTFDRQHGEIAGTWKLKLLGSGRPEYGEWTAKKISAVQARAIADELGE
jgi:hypothetical protein